MCFCYLAFFNGSTDNAVDIILFVNKQVMKLFPDISVNFFVVCFGDVGH